MYVGTTCERLVTVTYKLAYIWFKVKSDIVRFSFKIGLTLKQITIIFIAVVEAIPKYFLKIVRV